MQGVPVFCCEGGPAALPTAPGPRPRRTPTRGLLQGTPLPSSRPQGTRRARPWPSAPEERSNLAPPSPCCAGRAEATSEARPRASAPTPWRPRPGLEARAPRPSVGGARACEARRPPRSAEAGVGAVGRAAVSFTAARRLGSGGVGRARAARRPMGAARAST
ncbi:translation initiation factor IF-2-like [Penaeus monodon]|uniref:translation initiation factor IF-2-like n=1 Tax=Penaeus monodon TaxID=6687 RepID=UPI0018A6EC1C|nr:translation initiation factor IF-2-like [Penaeus monodon]